MRTLSILTWAAIPLLITAAMLYSVAQHNPAKVRQGIIKVINTGLN